MANCAILGCVDDVCRHVMRKDELFHEKFTILLGFRPMCSVIWKDCEIYPYALLPALPERKCGSCGSCHYSTGEF
jgi:hypothetical protein